MKILLIYSNRTVTGSRYSNRTFTQYSNKAVASTFAHYFIRAIQNLVKFLNGMSFLHFYSDLLGIILSILGAYNAWKF